MTRIVSAVAITACLFLVCAGIAPCEVPQSPVSIRVRTIVVETKEKADEVLRRLGAGESFTALAKELSIGPNAKAGGYIGTVATAELDEAMRNALVGLKVGDHTPVVRTALGYSIVQLTTDEYYNAGVQNYEMGHYEDAAKQLEKDIALNPDSALSYVYLGLCRAALDELEAAIEAYEKAITLNPSIAEAYYDLGNAYRRANNMEKSGAMYEKAIEMKPDFAAAHNNLAWLYAQEGKYLEEGVEHAQRATDLSPNNPVYIDTLAHLYYLQGDYVQAIDRIERAIRLDFKNEHYKEQLAKYQRAAAGEEPVPPATSEEEPAMPATAEEEPAPSPPPEPAAEEVTIEETVVVKGPDDQPVEVKAVRTGRQPEPVPGIKIQVLNGSPNPDAAESRAEWLRDQGYQVAHVGTADRSDWGRTTVLYRKGYLDLALEIAHKIEGNQDVEQLKTPSEYDVVIVVGKE